MINKKKKYLTIIKAKSTNYKVHKNYYEFFLCILIKSGQKMWVLLQLELSKIKVFFLFFTLKLLFYTNFFLFTALKIFSFEVLHENQTSLQKIKYGIRIGLAGVSGERLQEFFTPIVETLIAISSLFGVGIADVLHPLLEQLRVLLQHEILTQHSVGLKDSKKTPFSAPNLK